MSGIELAIIEVWAVSLAMAVGSSFDHRHPFAKSKFRTETAKSREMPHNLLFSCSSGDEVDAEAEVDYEEFREEHLSAWSQRTVDQMKQLGSW
jgi:hypothetical protein